ncbi:hypothetical protein O6P43_016651 [Quillaja saponaria]|uniref:Uncharacterized protein n=1 Tax=Quillaja saponaria TaxID=32244 RepID=A0AAD7LPT1_QUISA|nr:hypothetical protein O6P43_016651 [Quillaja saponaria]
MRLNASQRLMGTAKQGRLRRVLSCRLVEGDAEGLTWYPSCLYGGPACPTNAVLSSPHLSGLLLPEFNGQHTALCQKGSCLLDS